MRNILERRNVGNSLVRGRLRRGARAKPNTHRFGRSSASFVEDAHRNVRRVNIDTVVLLEHGAIVADRSSLADNRTVNGVELALAKGNGSTSKSELILEDVLQLGAVLIGKTGRSLNCFHEGQTAHTATMKVVTTTTATGMMDGAMSTSA